MGKSVHGFPVVQFPGLHGVTHGISTRHGGVSPAPYTSLNMGVSTGDDPERVEQNRIRFLDALGVDIEDVALARLVHGKDVTVIRQGAVTLGRVEGERPHRRFVSDGVVSNVPGLHFLLTFADCVPLLFHDTRRDVIGAAHAGWRGTAAGIGPAVVGAMQEAFGSDPADIVAAIGPSIGPCCYTVSPEVPAEFRRNGFEPALHERADGLFLDLWASNERQLRAAGVGLIENHRLCTGCEVAHFYSHRKEAGRTGRFALCIGLPA